MPEKVIFRTANLTDQYSTDIEGVGVLRWDGNKCYRWVKNKEAAATLSQGNVVFHDISDTQSLFNSVHSGATADLSMMAGVVEASTLNPLYYGWVQCYGFNGGAHVYNSATTAGAAGDAVHGVDGKAYADAGGKTAGGTAPVRARNLVLLEAVATDATAGSENTAAVDVFVNCL